MFPTEAPDYGAYTFDIDSKNQAAGKNDAGFDVFVLERLGKGFFSSSERAVEWRLFTGLSGGLYAAHGGGA